MRVTAEVRDLKKLNRMIACIIVIFSLYMILLVGSIVCAAYFRGFFTAMALILIILLIPSIIIGFVLATKGYNNSWKMEDYELYSQNEGLYYQGRKLHVNYNERNDVIYVHDLGDYGNQTKAEVYLTVFDDDKDRLLNYIRENGVKIEDERVVAGEGKFGMVTTLNLNVNRYRRR